MIVVGCGRVGARLAVELLGDGHEVAIVDRSASAFKRLPPDFTGHAIVGSGFDRNVLHAAGAERANSLAAVTSGDNSNILCARIARESYHIENVVARIYDPRRAEIYQRLGLPTVATVRWTTDQVLRKLVPQRVVSEWSDPSGRISLIERLLPASWYGHRLSLIEEESGARIVAVSRAGGAELGPGRLLGQEGDVLHVAIQRDQWERLEHVLQKAGASREGGVR